MMNFHTVSFLEMYKITSVAVTMSFQATFREEPTILNWGGGVLADTTKVGVPYRAAKNRNERRKAAAGMSATSSMWRTSVTMQTNRYSHAFLLLSWCLKNTGPK